MKYNEITKQKNIKRLLEFLKNNPDSNSNKIIESLNVSRSSVCKYLIDLQRRGMVVTSGRDELDARAFKWRLTGKKELNFTPARVLQMSWV